MCHRPGSGTECTVEHVSASCATQSSLEVFGIPSIANRDYCEPGRAQETGFPSLEITAFRGWPKCVVSYTRSPCRAQAALQCGPKQLTAEQVITRHSATFPIVRQQLPVRRSVCRLRCGVSVLRSDAQARRLTAPSGASVNLRSTPRAEIGRQAWRRPKPPAASMTANSFHCGTP
jgi:hypothetical protein